jgi:nucleoside 2-deoxyribosyltransferase
MTTVTTIYLAGPLFSVAEREFNKKICEALNKEINYIKVILPQDFASTLSDQNGFIEKAFEHSLKSIEKSDIIIAILDGPDVDSGTCIEIGYALAHKKIILGIRTDFRKCEDKGVNLMVSKSCTHLIWLSNSSLELDYTLNRIVTSTKKIISQNFKHKTSFLLTTKPPRP